MKALSSILPLLILVALMWAMLIRPQKQRMQRRQQVLGSLQVGDEVFMGGGLIGRLVELGEREARLEIAPELVVRVLREGIVDRVPPPADDDTGDDHEALHGGDAETE